MVKRQIRLNIKLGVDSISDKIETDCESFPEENFSDILAPYETNLDDSIVIHNFSVRGYLSLIQMDSVTHLLMVLRFM